MSWYEHEEENAAKGIDYDLAAAIENAGSTKFTVDQIEGVLAIVIDGDERGDQTWHWVVQVPASVYADWLDGSVYTHLTGTCDSHGWDCQSSLLEVGPHATAIQAAHECEEYLIQQQLVEQIKSGAKFGTWRDIAASLAIALAAAENMSELSK